MDAAASLASRTVVIGSAPHNLWGAAKAHASFVGVLASLGAKTYFVNVGAPPGEAGFGSPQTVHVAPRPVRSDAYPGSDVIETFSAGEAMFDLGLSWNARGYLVLLLGTYLYPFCAAVLHAAALLESRGVRPTVVLVPAGSDIWQIGHRLPHATELLLRNPSVSERVVYSRRFAQEINRLIARPLPFEVIPPAVDVHEFRPGDDIHRAGYRQRIGVEEKDFVLVHCSNMRPVKELGLTLTIAKAVADISRRQVVLVLVGPVTDHLSRRLGAWNVSLAASTPQLVRLGKLQVLLVGLQHDPRPFLWGADLAINTSLHDSFNISLAESLACGLPVLSTDVVGIAEVASRCNAGLFFSLDRNELGHLREEVRDFVPNVDAGLDRILSWVEPLLTRMPQALERAEVARALVLKHLTKGVVGSLWGRLLGKMK